MIKTPFEEEACAKKLKERNNGKDYCICCGRVVTKNAAWFHFHNGTVLKGGWIIKDSEQAEADEKFGGGADMGGYPVGSECLRKYLKVNPELTEYLWRRK